MLADLDHESCLDPALAGSKAARLAAARWKGLPVLPGFVVTAPGSREHMRLGAEALATRGSGGARLVVSAKPVESSQAIVEAGRRLGPKLVARSSTLLEGTGEWAGAFTSYLDLSPEQLPKAIAGCWASAFSVDALERQNEAGIEPGSFEMAVLVQPALDPQWGGVAELRSDRTIIVHGIEGSPAPLLQGLVPGQIAIRPPGESWNGDLARRLATAILDEIGASLRRSQEVLAANRCEWAVDRGKLWLLQLGRVEHREPVAAPTVSGTREQWLPIVRALVAAPGPLGAELVLPWALGGIPDDSPRRSVGPDQLKVARMLSRELAGDVWALPPDEAVAAAAASLDALLGPDQEQALEAIGELGAPDPELAGECMALVHGLRHDLADRGIVNDPEAAWHLSPKQMARALAGESTAGRHRVGAIRWEPLVAAVVLTHGDRREGLAASPGLGSGLIFRAVTAGTPRTPPPRSVLYSELATSVLSQLLWDATGVVIHAASPAAHVFESARSLGVPAVTGVELTSDDDLIVAVDGFTGVVATVPARP